MRVDWNSFDYEDKKNTAPPNDGLVWIREDYYADGVEVGFFDGYTFRTWYGTDDCHVSLWAPMLKPDDPGRPDE